MKLVTAIIRPEQLPAVKEALFRNQIEHITASTVMGTASRTEQRMYRGVEEKVSLFNRIRVEVAVNDALVDTVMQAIAEGARETGGYGRIYVTELVDTMTIWTGERGSRALK